jgi:hypothetical protein
MGCIASKQLNDVYTIDDSIHRMIVHDQKKLARDGKAVDVHYKPRMNHPLLVPFSDASGHTDVDMKDDDIVDTNRAKDGKPAVAGDIDPAEMEDTAESKEETDRLLYHAAHHNATVDPRDKVLAASA